MSARATVEVSEFHPNDCCQQHTNEQKHRHQQQDLRIIMRYRCINTNLLLWHVVTASLSVVSSIPVRRLLLCIAAAFRYNVF